MNTTYKSAFTLVYSNSGPCDIIPDGRMRRFKALAARSEEHLQSTFNRLITEGFGRTRLDMVFRNACEDCNACIPVRIDVTRPFPERSSRHHHNAKTNDRDIDTNRPASIDVLEHFTLKTHYMNERHPGTEPPDTLEVMTRQNHALIEGNKGLIVTEYRLRLEDDRKERELVAASWHYETPSGIYLDNYYYAPEHKKRGLGNYMILKCAELAREQGLPHVYLGPWTQEKTKYSYKSQFANEKLGPDKKWIPIVEIP